MKQLLQRAVRVEHREQAITRVDQLRGRPQDLRQHAREGNLADDLGIHLEVRPQQTLKSLVRNDHAAGLIHQLSDQTFKRHPLSGCVV